MKNNMKKWIVLIMIMSGMVSGHAATIILNPGSGGALAGFDGNELLAGTDQEFSDVGGISGLDLTVSLVEVKDSISDISASAVTDGFYMQIDGTTDSPGDSSGAVGLRFSFTTDGSEIVKSFRIFQGNGTPWKLNTYERVQLGSVSPDLVFNATADSGATITGNGTSEATIQGYTTDPGVLNFEIASEGGSSNNPIAAVDFRYFIPNRPTWNNNQLISFEIETAPPSGRSLIVLDPDVNLLGFDSSSLLAGIPQVFSNLNDIAGLNLTISATETDYASEMSSSTESDGFWLELLGTTDAPGSGRGILGVNFAFSTDGDKVVESFRMFQGNIDSGSSYKLNDGERVGLQSIEPGIIFNAGADAGAITNNNDTADVWIQGQTTPGVYNYEIASVGGSSNNPLASVDFRYFTGTSRPSWNNNQLVSFEITLVDPAPLRDVNIEVAGTNAVVFWSGREGVSYALQRKETLNAGSWSNVFNGLTISNGVVRVTNAVDSQTAFYRAVVE